MPCSIKLRATRPYPPAAKSAAPDCPGVYISFCLSVVSPTERKHFRAQK